VFEIDPAVFHTSFDVAPFPIGHHLSGHPLFTMERLIDLARFLPPNWVEYNPGNLPIGHDPKLTPSNGLSIEETVRRIETCGSWMAMKRVEQHPDYADLLHRCLGEIASYSEPLAPGMTHRRGFIFLSSPGAITPYHMDPEYNFLMQIRGSKDVHVLDGADRAVLSEQELEMFHGGGHRNLVFSETVKEKAKVFHLSPGRGMHIPITAPHWVKNGPDVSVSFSTTFLAPKSDRRALVYAMNAKLRRLGIEPAPYAKSKLADDIKLVAYKALRKLGV
jgi:hypothetical protein